MNQILQALKDEELDYYGMSYGKFKKASTLCTLYHARVCCVTTTMTTKRIILLIY